jgi:hypothetical protein
MSVVSCQLLLDVVSCQLLSVVVSCLLSVSFKGNSLCCVVGGCATMDHRVLSVCLVYTFPDNDLLEVETCRRDVTSDYFIITSDLFRQNTTHI